MTIRKVKLCKHKGCNNVATTQGFCRFHYLKNWRQIKEKAQKKALKSLNKYIDHLMHKHPDGYMDVIREDLKNYDHFSRKADNFIAEDDFHDIMDDLNQEDVEKIIGSIKVDDSY
ncbi:MAG: hypothetical protein HQM16_04110 [Deltaproteobacteria bacterium]|nr:hypothetical protein [Deltaproteobacteria bacterium]